MESATLQFEIHLKKKESRINLCLHKCTKFQDQSKNVGGRTPSLDFIIIMIIIIIASSYIALYIILVISERCTSSSIITPDHKTCYVPILTSPIVVSKAFSYRLRRTWPTPTYNNLFCTLAMSMECCRSFDW